MREVEGARPSRKVSLVFNHLEPNELALHLTFLEHKIIRRITFEDLKSYAESGTLEEVPKLERSVAVFNGLSQWIQCVVLSRPTPAQRADVIVKFVHVAQNLRKLQNFNSLMGVVGSLSHSALARLTKTMDCVPVEERKVLKELTALVSSSSNFSAYRKALTEGKGFKIPILGVHLKDLISLHTALPDYVEGGLINFRKLAQLAGIFTELDNLAQSMPPAQANVDLLNTLRASLDLAYSEDEIYELSLSREPKTSVSPTRSPGLGDGTGSYEKQLQTMVDAVFRNYDSNHDGFISKEEFQQICTNHPAIDAFFVLDENRDGKISKLELERYLRNKKNAGSRHNFHEQTYFKPTFCIHCSGLLWGLIRQGYKCRNCGVNAHKYCKEYMLHECKMGSLLYFPSPEPHSKRRGFRIRKKSSSQSESGSPPSPKLFNSLEQLSLSVESTDLPHSHHSSDHSLKAMTSTVSTPRRLSSVLNPSSSRRPSTSVPSSPKLGFSLPLWAPCKSLFHPPTSPGGATSLPQPSNITTTNSQPPHHHPAAASSFVYRAGQGLGKLFGSPSSSPQLSKGRKAVVPSHPPPSSSAADATSIPPKTPHSQNPSNQQQQQQQRQHIGGVH
ncbi:RAS guanyl-releasing protein 1 [Folsomia candida]|uniref:RAS guanyl-releasing protein 1 n=3 Tax=Folsomia candida TaxID=158441 RepID=A0A226DC85_FOLCA|nr:RAS guanyl-releasing protein 1 [Folsomia candida]